MTARFEKITASFRLDDTIIKKLVKTAENPQGTLQKPLKALKALQKNAI
jgi:hypothetical protein